VPDLVAEVAQQCSVRLSHRDPQLLAVHVVALGEVEVMTPLWCPVTTFSVSLDSRSNASP